jgi:hypothetical protein
MIRLSQFGLPLIGGALVSMAMFACSSSSDDKGDATGGASSTGGAAATGGSKGSTGGSATGTGGSATGSGGSGVDPYVCDAKPPADKGGSGKDGDACCNTSIGNVGKCVKESTISDATQKAAFGYDSCSKADTLKCAPDPAQITAAEANGVYEACSTKIGGVGAALEGRCLPKCFVAGVGAAAQLQKETCKTADLVCTPCYNPIDGTETGACKQKSGDAPKDAAPAPYKKCGDNLGICVPEALVTDATQKAALEKAFGGDGGVPSGCADGELCAPTLKAKDQAACFAHCTSVLSLEGACVPTFLVPASQRSLLSPDKCGTGELCAPCLDPTSMPANQSTGACN